MMPSLSYRIALVAAVLMMAASGAQANQCLSAVMNAASVQNTYKDAVAYEVRIAAAEHLATNLDHGQATGIGVKQEVVDFLNAIVRDRLGESDQARAEEMRPFISALVLNSPAVRRLQSLMGYAERTAAAPITVAESLTAIQAPSKKGFLGRLMGRPAAVPKIDFLNAEQFARALEGRPVDSRLDYLKASAAGLPKLTHLEIFRILYAFKGDVQIATNEILNDRLLGRIDFFPLMLAEEAIKKVNVAIIGDHLKKTGGAFELEELISFFRKHQLLSSRILDLVPEEAVTHAQIKKALAKESDVTLESAFFYLNLAMRASRSYQDLRSAQTEIASRLEKPEERTDFDTRFRTMMEGSEFEIEMNLNTLKLRAAAQSPDRTVADLTELMGHYEGRLSGSQAVEFLKLIPNEAVRFGSDKNLVSLRDEMRRYLSSVGSTAKDAFTASDLYLMDYAQNYELARRIVVSLKSKTVTRAEHDQIKLEILRLFSHAGVHDISINPEKTKLPAPNLRDTTLNNIRRYFDDAVSAISTRR